MTTKAMVRYRDEKTLLTKLFLMFIFVSLSIAPSAAEGQSFLEIADLSEKVDRIFPGPETRLLGIEDSSGQAYLLALSGAILDSQLLAGKPTSVGYMDVSPKIRRFVILTESSRIKQGGFELSRVDVDSSTLRPAIVLKNDTIVAMTNPSAHMFSDATGTQKILVWDKSSKENAPYQVVDINGKVLSEQQNGPYIFAPINGTNRFLGLSPTDQRASLIDIDSGVSADIINLDIIRSKNPDSVTAFVPRLSSGGVGDVIVANSESKLISVISVTNVSQRRVLLLDRGIAPLPYSKSFRGKLLVASDRYLTTILVGAVGSDVVQVYRSIGTALERLGSIELGIPIKDICVVGGVPEYEPEDFVFLRADGLGVGVARGINVRFADKFLLDDSISDEITKPFPDTFSLERASVSEIKRVQRVLASINYSVGSIDGMLGDQTKFALKTFEIVNNLENEKATLAALNTVVDNIRVRGIADSSEVKKYIDFVQSSVKGFDAMRLLSLGRAHGDPDSSCFGQNSLPPRELWSKSIEFARLVRTLEEDFGLDVKVLTAFRNPKYNSCVGKSSLSNHLQFQAFEIGLAATGQKVVSISSLTELLTRLQADGRFTGAFEVTGETIQVTMAALKITAEDLYTIAPRASSQFVSEIVAEQAILTPAGINLSGRRLSHFLAMVAFESGGFRLREANFNYSAVRLLQVYPSYFSSLEDAKPYEYHPEMIANRVFESRLGNGNYESGDGWKYRPRGLFQVTGRLSYRMIGKNIGLDLEKEPELINDQKYSLKIAASIWQSNNLNSVVDQNDDPTALAEISKKIDGRFFAAAERAIWFSRVARIWIVETPLSDVRSAK